ncbi:N-acetylaspartate synthetase isoform X1 [Camelus dromedarius]|uniref:N-acetylaspartate synthetase isoform X1 n=1 Tax=Camelus dromedarius TaxID=9838 RepID=UPI003119E7B0
MHCGPPDMVCETKIVAAEDHEALPGAKKDALLAAAGAMWPPLAAAPGPAAAPAAPPPAPGPQPHGDAGGAGPPEGRGVYIREIRAAEQEAARRIFYDGIMERIPNTAFRGLRQHPRTQLLYVLLAGGWCSVRPCPALRSPAPPLPAALCFALTRSLLLTCLVPAGLLGLRYYYSRKVVLAYLDCALHTDMADIEQYYMKPPGSCFWVAVLDGNVVGIVAARAHAADNTVELLRMSVDSRFRGKGIAKALGRKVLEFALVHNYSAVVLGTTAVKVAAHKLYESLGFRHMGSSDRYVMPGMTLSLAERLFFQVRYHRYRLQLREE